MSLKMKKKKVRKKFMKQKSVKKKLVKKPGKIHRFSPGQEKFLVKRIPKNGKFKQGELEGLRRGFNKAWRTRDTTRCIGNKCARLRLEKSSRELEAELAKLAALPVAKKTRKTLSELHKDLVPLHAVITEIIDETKSPPTPEFIVVIRDNGGKEIWRGNHYPDIEVFQKVQPKK